MWCYGTVARAKWIRTSLPGMHLFDVVEILHWIRGLFDLGD
uniref:Uncharacterized protein n=1 Tax=Arundo donax TaxID=35708 RepID=A0A0A9C0A3_ARUDO